MIAAALVGCTPAAEKDESPTAPPAPVLRPVAGFDFVADGLTLTFINSSRNAVSYRWDFGDGLASATTSPSHTFRKPGRYIVRLDAFNSANDLDSVQQPIDVVEDFGF